LPEKYVRKINKMPKFYTILVRENIRIPEFLQYLPEKINNISEFYTIFARNLHNNCPKIFSGIFFLGGGTSPMPMGLGSMNACKYC